MKKKTKAEQALEKGVSPEYQQAHKMLVGVARVAPSLRAHFMRLAYSKVDEANQQRAEQNPRQTSAANKRKQENGKPPSRRSRGASATA